MTINAREKLVELLTEFYGSDPMYYGVDALAIAEHLIGNGVTPVVRCKDCKYFKTRLCENEDNYDDWFCADGERKENE